MARPAAHTTKALYDSLSTLGSAWPRDVLRPETSFGRSVVQAAQHALTEPTSSSASTSPQMLENTQQRQVLYRNLDEYERQTTERAFQALFAIKSGKASAEYPVPDSILRPASNSIYYTRLADMLKQAADGSRISLTFAQRIRLFFGRPI